ncbi:MAG: PQQ-dependent sugar dehydrogenase [Planctomycetes bacterium]|nr:PQQ-dependent sugar dehydrogenase [Planctomycetota bacterium]
MALAQDAAKNSSHPYGIQKRIPWTTSKITGRPEPPLPYRTEQVFPKLKFVNPVEFVSEPGTDRLFVMELTGKIFSFKNDSNAENPDLVIDLAKEISGMTRAYGMTFDPDYRNNRFCYLSYILAAEEPLGTRVSRFKMTDTDPPTIDPNSEQILIRWKSGGHNGGALQFGPDGYFYISTGDGGPAFPPDPLKSGQDVSNILSSILRIDISHSTAEKPYSIPKDNPFVDLEGARGEVWAYGLRNPWKMSFDPKTGDLWVGDVGWELWEMVYRIEKGGNYGWSLMEAHQPVHRERKRGPTPISPPTVEHSHIEARSITGGYVYHGKRLKELAGAYIYGDYVTGKVWGLRYDGSKVTWQQELVDAPIQIICFGLDQKGELYLVDYAGTIHRLVPNPSATANRNFPKTLSETGLFSSVKDHQPAPGVIPYSISAEPWADNATVERFVALPGRSQLGVFKESNAQIGFLKGMWSFPTDGVLAKTVSLEMEKGNPASSRRLETQILHFDGDMWRGYNYIWNDEQTDAVLADIKGMNRTFTIRDSAAPMGKRQQTWHFASRSECILCHTTRSGSVQGFNPLQLNSNHDYAEVTDNQLHTLEHIGSQRRR